MAANAASKRTGSNHQMPRRPTAVAHDPDAPARAVLCLLVSTYPALWTTEDIARQVGTGGDDGTAARIRAIDGLSDLIGHGLAYRMNGGFAVASPAAVRARELAE